MKNLKKKTHTAPSLSRFARSVDFGNHITTSIFEVEGGGAENVLCACRISDIIGIKYATGEKHPSC